jgi:hypothetical protein
VLSKEDLKVLVNKKIGETAQQERLDLEYFYDKLKSSRKNDDNINEGSPFCKIIENSSFIEVMKKDASI